MVIKGRARGGAAKLAAHLLRADTNERVEVLEVRGLATADLKSALLDMETVGSGTRSSKPLYHAAINTRADEPLTPQQREIAINRLEDALGLTGQPRAVVEHEKEGRGHLHVVWSRVDLDTMTMIPDSHNYRKHEEVARELEREFGHERVQGAHVEREGKERPERTPSHAEMMQADRSGLTPQQVKIEITDLWNRTGGGAAFAAALDKETRYVLAQGDKRDFVLVDEHCGTHSLGRRIDGMKAAELRQRMAEVDRESLLTIAAAKELQIDRSQGRVSAYDEIRRDDALAAAAIEKEKVEKQFIEKPANEAQAARDLAYKEKEAAKPPSHAEKQINDILHSTTTGAQFRRELDNAGLTLARVTALDVKVQETRRDEISENLSRYDFVPQPDRRERTLNIREDELVAVNKSGSVFRLSEHRVDYEKIGERVGQVGGWELPSAGEAVIAAELAERRTDPARAPEMPSHDASDVREEISHTAERGLHVAASRVDGTMHSVASFADSILGMVTSTEKQPQHRPREIDMAARLSRDPAMRAAVRQHDADERKRTQLVEAIRRDMEAGRDLDPVVLRQMPRDDLENMKARGDAALHEMVRHYGHERDDRERGEERERER